MDVYKTHGAFSWSELMTADPAAAAAFYAELFGWKVEEMDMGTGPYRVLKIGDTSVGGIMDTPPGAAGMPSAWGCYVTVDDVDATARRCAELGGKVLMAPTDIPQVGRFAVLQDPQGAVLNAIRYAPG
ncbi:MAG: VOC family protein [Burkholderiales bacterium]|nr:VOC family protein [Burkholderiales bacterium]